MEWIVAHPENAGIVAGAIAGVIIAILLAAVEVVRRSTCWMTAC